MEACGATATAAQLLQICPSSTAAGGCTATVLPSAAAATSGSGSAAIPACAAGNMEVLFAYVALNTRTAAAYTIGPHSGTLGNFTEQLSLCVPDGCHPFSVTNTSASDAAWFMCGQRGTTPSETEVCVESAAGLCYGLTGCARVKSYVHHSSSQWFFLSDAERGSSDYLQVGATFNMSVDVCVCA